MLSFFIISHALVIPTSFAIYFITVITWHKAGYCFTFLDLVVTPVSQAAVHSVHGVHSDSTQSTGIFFKQFVPVLQGPI